MDDHTTQPPVGHGPAFVLKISAATLLGGFALAVMYRWGNHIFALRSSPAEAIAALVAALVFVVAILVLERTLRPV
jgi:hypothetical protein